MYAHNVYYVKYNIKLGPLIQYLMVASRQLAISIPLISAQKQSVNNEKYENN